MIHTDPFQTTETAPETHTARLYTAQGYIRARLIITGANDESLDGACIEIEIVDLPEGWSIDNARGSIAAEMRSRRSYLGGVPDEIHTAARTGAVYFAHEQQVRRAG